MKTKFTVTVDLRNPETHRALVTIRPTAGHELPERLHFPVWTPGSYLIREYPRHVTRLTPGRKLEKNIWKIEGSPREVRYEVYGFERTVRTSFIDERYISLVGASLLPLLGASFDIELLLPKNWIFVASALRFRRVRPGVWRARARDDDHWIDSPIVGASPGFGGRGSFVVRGIRHHLAWVGTDCARPMRELERDFRKLAEATCKFFDGAPFREYWFLLHFGTKLYGGLEHRDSQLSQFDGSLLADRKDYDGFLRLVAHEYFHAWNVKSLRPRALGPFDYERENYTEELWFAEGLTDYFDDLLPLEAGLSSEEEYRKARLKGVQGLSDGLPSQKRRSVGESSFDAWIRHYRGDEDSDNTDVSYYTKGALLGWCWDAELRHQSKGRWTLARLLRQLWKERGIDAYVPLADAPPGYTRAEIIEFAEQKTKLPHDFLEAWVTLRKPLPWRAAARFFDVRFEERVTDPLLHFAGFSLQWKGSQGLVSKVLSGSVAEAAGIAAGDELVALDGWRVTDADRLQGRWKRAMAARRPLKISIARLERLTEASLKPRSHGPVGVSVELAPSKRKFSKK